MSDKVFVNGMVVKKPNEKAPDFVKCSISLKVEELITFMRTHENNGWVNVDVKESRDGKFYAELNTWKPKKQESGGDFNGYKPPEPGEQVPFEDDQIPF